MLREHWRAAARAGHLPAEVVADPWDEVVARLDSTAWTHPLASALVLGIPQGTARSRLHRARTALKLALGKEEASWPSDQTDLTTRTR